MQRIGLGNALAIVISASTSGTTAGRVCSTRVYLRSVFFEYTPVTGSRQGNPFAVGITRATSRLSPERAILDRRRDHRSPDKGRPTEGYRQGVSRQELVIQALHRLRKRGNFTRVSSIQISRQTRRISRPSGRSPRPTFSFTHTSRSSHRVPPDASGSPRLCAPGTVQSMLRSVLSVSANPSMPIPSIPVYGSTLQPRRIAASISPPWDRNASANGRCLWRRNPLLPLTLRLPSCLPSIHISFSQESHGQRTNSGS